jgi:hypothetical protein
VSRALLDTDILSEVLKQRDENVARAAADYLARHGEFAVAVVSVMEIAYGLQRGARIRQFQEIEATLRDSRRKRKRPTSYPCRYTSSIPHRGWRTVKSFGLHASQNVAEPAQVQLRGQAWSSLTHPLPEIPMPTAISRPAHSATAR